MLLRLDAHNKLRALWVSFDSLNQKICEKEKMDILKLKATTLDWVPRVQEQASKPLHSLLDKGVTNCNQQEVSCMVDLGSFCSSDQPIIFEKFE